MQSAYKAYEKGEINYNQLTDVLKSLHLSTPKENKFSNFREFSKQVKEPKRSVPQITINLQNQLQCTVDKIESPRIGRRVVTLQDSPVHKNENSYLFSQSTNKKREQLAEMKDNRLICNNIYLEKKKKAAPLNQEDNGNILILKNDENLRSSSPKSIFTNKKNSSTVKSGVGLFSEKSTDKKFLFKVVNTEQRGNGDIIKNNFSNKIKSKQRNHLDCSEKWMN